MDDVSCCFVHHAFILSQAFALLVGTLLKQRGRNWVYWQRVFSLRKNDLLLDDVVEYNVCRLKHC